VSPQGRFLREDFCTLEGKLDLAYPEALDNLAEHLLGRPVRCRFVATPLLVSA